MTARTDAGFSLVEALVAMVLLGTIVTGLATVTAQWLPNWSRGLASVQRNELLTRGLERLAGIGHAFRNAPGRVAIVGSGRMDEQDLDDAVFRPPVKQRPRRLLHTPQYKR